jgi:starch synthase
MATRKLKILLVAAEVAPFAKVGGLADVAGALPKALQAMGHDVRVAMPCYRMIEDNPAYRVTDELAPFPVHIHDGYTEMAHVRKTMIGGKVPVYLIGSDRYFTDATESKKVYSFSPEPYVFFDRAVAEFVPRLQPAWTPDIVHCNDWHTGLVPVYLRTFFQEHPTWSSAAIVFTIHNLAYQGEFDFDVLRYAGLPDYLFTYDKLEFYGRMSFMKGGLTFADFVNTVSKTYAEEIQTPEFGCRLEGLLRYLAAEGRLTGIVNGIDYEEYNPATDPRIAAHFDAASPDGKAICKEDLQKLSGLPTDPKAAVIGLISRLADQKGFDIIRAAADGMMGLPIQFVLLGTGDPHYETFFRELEGQYPTKMKAHIGFDAILAQKIYAGADMFLMPSRFEPCGLGQLMSLRYGTIPIVRATGGLADTIVDYDAATGRGNGFSFKEYDADVLLATIKRAVDVYQDRNKWQALTKAALQCDYSWKASAAQYVELFRRARTGLRIASAA